MRKLFGGINLTWPKLIIFAVIAGLYTGLMAYLPQTQDTSFADITISFEVWVFFGTIIIMNSKKIQIWNTKEQKNITSQIPISSY